jgi:hypothetical protein
MLRRPGVVIRTPPEGGQSIVPVDVDVVVDVIVDGFVDDQASTTSTFT